MRRLDAAWRMAGTAFGFLLFGCGGLVIRFLVFPLAMLAVRDPVRRQSAVRRLIARAFGWLTRILTTLGVFSVEWHGREHLRTPGALILPSHPSLIDVVLLMAHIDDANCIVKAALWNNPFTRGPVTAAGFVANNSGPELIDACVASLRASRHSPLIVFPEGTRGLDPAQPKLQRGAAYIALRSRAPIVPVRIRCVPPLLPKNRPWYHPPPTRPHFTIEVFAPWLDYHDADLDEGGAARRLTERLRHLFVFGKPCHEPT